MEWLDQSLSIILLSLAPWVWAEVNSKTIKGRDLSCFVVHLKSLILLFAWKSYYGRNLYLLESNWVLQLLHPFFTGSLQALPGSHKLLAFLIYFLCWWVLAFNHCPSFIQNPLDLLFVGIHLCLKFLWMRKKKNEEERKDTWRKRSEVQ